MVDLGLRPEEAWGSTLRQLVALSERWDARERAADRRAGEIVAMIYNTHRDAKKDPRGRSWLDFYPHWQEEKQAMTDEQMLRAMMIWTRVTAARS